MVRRHFCLEPAQLDACEIGVAAVKESVDGAILKIPCLQAALIPDRQIRQRIPERLHEMREGVYGIYCPGLVSRIVSSLEERLHEFDESMAGFDVPGKAEERSGIKAVHIRCLPHFRDGSAA